MHFIARHPAQARRGLSLAGLLLALTLGSATALADWPTYGTLLGMAGNPTIVGWFRGARVFPNSDGGGTVGYFGRFRGNQSYPVVHFARVLGDGTLLANDGAADATNSDLCSDGTGGIYIAQMFYGGGVGRWPDPPGWWFQLLPMTCCNLEYTNVSCALTPAGGCMVAWDRRSSRDSLLVSTVRSDATLEPGWPSTGLYIGRVEYGPLGDPIRVVPDVGGGYVAWWRSAGGPDVSLRLTRVTTSGAVAPGWSVGGRELGLGPFGTTLSPALVRLASGDAMVLAAGGGDAEFAARAFTLWRVRADGTLPPGWPATGIVVRGVSSVTSVPLLVPDGGDGAFLVWADQGGRDVRAMHVLGDGTIVPGWTSDGRTISSPSAIYGPAAGSESGWEGRIVYNFRACPDGAGGLFVGWDDGRGATGASVWIAHRTGDGDPGAGWTVDGRMVNDPAIASHLGGLAPAADGSLLAAWSGEISPDLYGSWLARVEPDVDTPVLASVVSAAVVDGRVHIEWSLDGGASQAVVYRSAAGGPWDRVTVLTPDGRGQIAFDDASVEPGTRYDYRLGIMDGGVEILTAETWVDVPRWELALERARPNPSPRGALEGAFTLPDASPARLELLDVAGRRMAAHDVGSLGPGRHVVTLAREGSLPAGAYVLRLTQHGNQRVARAVVLK
jgi:hypothetical protein